MIARLIGRLLEAGEGRVVVECAGVGYEVNVSEAVLAALPDRGEQVDLYVRQVIREDDHALFGFLASEERALFDMLRGVKGCGSRISLSVLGTLGAGPAAAAIAAQDAKGLARAPGVGARLAERIIVELKDKVSSEFRPAPAAAAAKAAKPKPMDELVEALMALGYRRGEVEAVAEDARAEGEDLEAQLVAALRRLQK